MTGFIGGGKMAEALIKGMTAGKTRGDIVVSEPLEERRRHLGERYGVKTTSDNREAASSSDIVVLAVKPQAVGGVLDEIKGVIDEKKTVVSIAAGITISFISERLGTRRIIRVMPNTPALLEEGISVMSLCECFPDGDAARVREMFMSVGRVLVLPEKYMDAVTALSGSGPAFIALFAEYMAEGAMSAGLGEDDARELALRTLVGTAKLIDYGLSPNELIKMVATPGGTTEAGLRKFEEMGLRAVVIEAIRAAEKRSKELGGA